MFASAALRKSYGARSSQREPVEVWRMVWRVCFDRYRPERHYMRGPGPRWREKHRQGWAGR